MQALFDKLYQLVKYYLPDDKTDVIRRAFWLAEQAHRGQYRTSGEPYITHPVAVAVILAGMRLDYETIVAALLHDVIEDTPMGYAEIESLFGHRVAELVEGVSKLDKLKFRNRKEAQTENFRKMIMAMVQDIRVVLIKLADRTHNMRTLGSLRPDKRRRIARETLEIYAPLAHRLGIHHIKTELEELSFQAIYPHRFDVISRVVKSARGHRKEMIQRILGDIEHRLNDAGIDAIVSGQEKNLYAIYQKMMLKEQRFESIMDIYAFHIIVKDIDTCYRVLGQLHGLYKPRPGLFKDYIAIPKANGYQALHSSMVGPHGVPVEVRIRTDDMEQMAEIGVAACWAADGDEINSGTTVQVRAQRWMQSLLELQQSSGNSQEFIESVKSDLFPDEIYVFTPKGRIIELPAGATSVDFAYAVHSDVGYFCVGAKVDRQPYPLSQPLQSGQTVEIITAQNSRPSAAWLNFVVSSKARVKIRQALKSLKREDSIHLGRRLLNYALGESHPLDSIPDYAIQEALKRVKLASIDDLLAEIGIGNMMSVMAAKLLLSKADQVEEKVTISTENNKLLIKGADGILLTLAKCCHPIPNDPIIGYVSPGKGVVIHHESCHNLIGHEKEPEKYIATEWMPNLDQEFVAELRLNVFDHPGVLANIIVVINSEESNIHSVNTVDKEGKVRGIVLLLSVRDQLHLATIMRRLSILPEVVNVARYHN